MLYLVIFLFFFFFLTWVFSGWGFVDYFMERKKVMVKRKRKMVGKMNKGGF